LRTQRCRPGRAHGWVANTLVYTPAHLIWDGPAAVLVFFILSGFVLAAPFAAGRRGGWRGYYPQRLIRLYVPVWASLVFALGAASLVVRHVHADASYFVNLHASTPHGTGQALRNAPLLFKTGWLNAPLWSLRFEVAFSLALPGAILFGRLLRRWWVLKLVACIVIVMLGAKLNSLAILYPPVFGIGTVLAFEQEEVRRLTSRLGTRGWWALTVGALLLLESSWYAHGLHLDGLAPLGQGLSVIGAAGILVVFCDWTSARTTFETPALQWLGKRSFSLYLVHEPIIITTAFALGGSPNAALLFGIAVPIALTVAELFFRLVEAPSHRFSRAVGRRFRDSSGRTR
jgi:peptidoglycan/LPS O-acetylase OafA/YrhL